MPKLNILIASAEAVPFAKVGGLADVTGSLPKALEKIEYECSLVMPKYKRIDEERFNLKKDELSFEVWIGEEKEEIFVYEGRINKNVPVYLLWNEKYFNRDEVYGCADDLQRFVLFCKAVIEMQKKLNLKFDVIHANDWQTALIPCYLKTIYKDDEFFKKVATVYTIHNLGYQGLFEPDSLRIIGLGPDEFNMEKLEFYGKVNFMKAGIVYSDVINTVSEEYSREIQTEEYGEGLDGLLRKHSNKLYGIINGIDLDEWNPETDKDIKAKFSFKNIAKKSTNKRALQKDLKLSQKKAPLFGMVSRLASQKGFDILMEIIDELMKIEIQLVILGTGDKSFEEKLKVLAEEFPKKLSINLKFDNILAHKIYAGCDFFLMPSRYEPCGLGQMIALRYGTIPIVRKTGGLADTVEDFDKRKRCGNGFVFTDYNSLSLLDTINRAINLYKDQEATLTLIKNAMESDFSWERQAMKYGELYEKALTRKI